MTNECARVLKLKTKFYWFSTHVCASVHRISHCDTLSLRLLCVLITISNAMSAKHCSKLSKYLINRWLLFGRDSKPLSCYDFNTCVWCVWCLQHICIPDSVFSLPHKFIDAKKLLESRNRFNEPDFIQQQQEQQKKLKNIYYYEIKTNFNVSLEKHFQVGACAAIIKKIAQANDEHFEIMIIATTTTTTTTAEKTERETEREHQTQIAKYKLHVVYNKSNV